MSPGILEVSLVREENSVLIVEPLAQLGRLYSDIVEVAGNKPVMFNPTFGRYANFCAESYNDSRIQFRAALLDVANYFHSGHSNRSNSEFVPYTDVTHAMRHHSPNGRIIFIGGEGEECDKLRKENSVYRIGIPSNIYAEFEKILRMQDEEFKHLVDEQVKRL